MDNKDAEFYKNHLKDLEKTRDGIVEKYSNLLLKNIDYLRQFHMQLIGIALLALSFIVPILVSEKYFKYPLFAYLGSLFLAIVAISGVAYLNKILTDEHQEIGEVRKFYQDSFGNEIKKIVSYHNSNKNFSEYLKSYVESGTKYAEDEKKWSKPIKLDPFSNKVSWLFILGIFFILISLLPLDKIYLEIKEVFNLLVIFKNSLS